MGFLIMSKRGDGEIPEASKATQHIMWVTNGKRILSAAYILMFARGGRYSTQACYANQHRDRRSANDVTETRDERTGKF
jgi:hypothetical protein